MNNQPPNQQPVYITNELKPETEGASTTAMWLEIIFGLFSFLGIGHAYSGRTILGIVLMIGWWIFLGIGGAISAVTLGIGLCVFAPLFIGVPIISGIQARTYTRKTGGKGSWKSVIIQLVAGLLTIIIFFVILANIDKMPDFSKTLFH